MPSPDHAVHRSTLGHLGEFLPCDKHGYVPTEKTKPWDLEFDHNEPTHHDDGTLTGYGHWWETERWPVIAAKAMDLTEVAQMAMDDSRSHP